MDQAGIIRDLLGWLESHLDQPLSLDNVAAKAGYSKWHLQRMFKDVTGHAIGAYIRARRLSKAAVALRLTGRPILDIALQYRFDSQQTFTRAFKKQFNQTPALYRRSSEWNSFGIRPPIRLDDYPMPQAQFVTLPETVLVGHNAKLYLYAGADLQLPQRDAHPVLAAVPAGDVDTAAAGAVRAASGTRPSHEKDDEQEVLYTTALPADQQALSMQSNQSVILEAGDYVQFSYQGPRTALQEFILLLYGTCMPTLGLVRRQGQDIERFYTHGGKKRSEPPMEIRCEYLIPIRPQQ